MQPFWSSLTLLLPLNFKEVALRPRLGPNWQHCMWICDFMISIGSIFFLNFWFIYECWDTICPDSELILCRVLSGAAVQLFSVSAVVPVQDTVRHPAEPGSGEVPRRCGTHHTIDYPQDGNCFAADKLTQADHSIQYSIEQNFKSKMGSWGWQDEGWITSKAWY